MKTTSVQFIKWIGDNTGALAWAAKSRCSSLDGQWANLISAWFQVFASFHVVEVKHLPGVEMGFIDDVSRGRSHPLALVVPFIKVDDNDSRELFKWCDPTVERPAGDNFVAFAEIGRLLKKIID